MKFLTWYFQYISCIYLGCIYSVSKPCTEEFKKEKLSSHFSVKDEVRVYKNTHSFFPAIFPAKQNTQSPDLNDHTIRKKCK